MASSTVENYLKQICMAQQDLPATAERVSMGALASAMAVAPGTATAMIKALSESGLVDYEPRAGVRLTAAGERLALHVLRRHRLIELFLVQVLGLDWSEVHDEAEELEHAISDKVLDRLDAMLGHPTVDPHGDPIPSSGGHIVLDPLQNLATCHLHQPVQIARVLDQNRGFLTFANTAGLVPGTSVTVERRDTDADAVHIRSADRQSAIIGTSAARKILVRQAE